MQQTLPAPREVILEQLERMLASDTFAGAERSRVLLKFLVEHVLENQPDRLKEYTIGSEALGRGDSFDPRIDPIVRAEASRLRNRLERYYATKGVADTVLITLPKGSYVPQLQSRAIPEAAPAAATAGDPLSRPGRFQRFLWFVLGGITVGAAVTLFVWWGGSEPPAGELEIIDLELGASDRSLGSDWGNDMILSPDGSRIVFVARGSDHVQRLMTMRLDQGQRTVVPLPDTDGARGPFFSPDGRWVGFWAEPKLKKVSVDGGSPVELTDVSNFGGASWGGDGYIIASIDGALRSVPETPGESTVLLDLTKERVDSLWPELLPGGRHVLFTAVGPRGPDAASVEVLSLSDRKTKTLVRGGTFGRYLSGGYLLYVNQGTLFAVPFDPQRLDVQQTRVPVLDERVAYNTIFGNAKFDIARNGTLIYRRRPPLVVSWLHRGGKIEPLLTRPGAYTFPRLSPDGGRLAFNVTDSGVLHTQIHDLRLKQTTTLPFAPGSMSPVWHPGGGFLVLGSRDAGMSWMKSEDMTDDITRDDVTKVQPLTRSPNVQIPWSFMEDGTRLAYLESTAATGLDLWTIRVSHSDGKLTKVGEPEIFLQTPFVESAPSFSPDGRWLVYGWGPKGIWDVYVQPFPPDPSKVINVSQRGGRIARWLPGGREIVYRTDEHRLMVVDYQVNNGKFVVGTPKEWTNVRLGDTGVISNFDVYGDRILGLMPEEKEAERIRNQATVRLRFSEEVRRRLSRGGK